MLCLGLGILFFGGLTVTKLAQQIKFGGSTVSGHLAINNHGLLSEIAVNPNSPLLLQYRKYRVWALVYRQPLCQEHLRSSFVQNGTATVFINPLVTTCCIPRKTKHTAPLTLHAVTVIIKNLPNHHLCIRITSSPCLCNQFTFYNFYLNYPLVSVSMQSPVLLLIQLTKNSSLQVSQMWLHRSSLFPVP